MNWVHFNEGSSVSTWLPVLVVRRHFFYFSQRIGRAQRFHVIWGRDALRGKGLSVNGRNLFSGEQW
jgi:hypothetical protein